MKTIDVGRDFSRVPVGRYVEDGSFTGEHFRLQLLEPAFKAGESVRVILDTTAGYGSSFLEEAFGGLVRSLKLAPAEVISRLTLDTDDPSLKEEILEYILEARLNG